VDPYTAIIGITDAPYRGECYGTLQLAILHSAAVVLGPERFNDRFPDGRLVFGTLNNWTDLSVVEFMPPQQQRYASLGHKIGRANMVPGDWVYMKNWDDYEKRVPGGYWTGENAIYMGRYDYILGGRPDYKDAWRTQRFTGLGAEDMSETKLKLKLRLHYHTETGTPFRPPSGIRWTITVGPGTSDY
jgi:hypothetical protein